MSAVDIDRSVGDFSYPENHKYDAGFGLSEQTIDYICNVKDDPEWVREFRTRALKVFNEKPMPTNWATKDLEAIEFQKIRYYLSSGSQPKRSWDEVPDDVKRAAIPVLRHRVSLSPELQISGQDVDGVLAALLRAIPAPR